MHLSTTLVHANLPRLGLTAFGVSADLGATYENQFENE